MSTNMMLIAGLAVWIALINVVSTSLLHDKRIVNGEEAEPSSHPYIVSLQACKNGTEFVEAIYCEEDDLQWGHFCGGVLIDRNWVLTAAHCVEVIEDAQNSARVKLGEHDLKVDTRWEFSRGIQKIIKHPWWCSCAGANDIALIRLDSPVELDDKVQVAKLSQDDSDFVYDTCVLAGWGRVMDKSITSKFLREVNMTHIPNDLCASMMNKNVKEYLKEYPKELLLKFRKTDLELVLEVRESDICVLDVSSGPGGQKASCQGDSGGPMMCGEDHRTLVGINSRGLGCQGPELFTRVSKYVTWIRDTIDDVDGDYEGECGEVNAPV